MVDNRSASVFGIGSSLTFKSGDISGTAAKMSDEKMGQGTEYFAMEQGEEDNNFNKNAYTDRSAQLRATLNSLAMMNVANVLKDNSPQKILEEKKKKEEKNAKSKHRKEPHPDFE
ncbi:MAG: hypothetical protein PHV37_09625 [Candidatus Gastranaerophilales bacterium]|nr:hypothetical protein [Candidatus Gastranaerophilales bacterium]